MANNLFPIAGMKIFIGPVFDLDGDDVEAVDFSTLTGWLQIKGWETMGSFGDTAAEITESIIDQNRDLSIKGTRNAGTMQNQFEVYATDPGQLALIAAEKTPFNYAFRIEGNDKPLTGGAPKNSMRYFAALVTSASEQGGGANTAQKFQSTLKINTNIVRVAASAT